MPTPVTETPFTWELRVAILERLVQAEQPLTKEMLMSPHYDNAKVYNAVDDALRVLCDEGAIGKIIYCDVAFYHIRTRLERCLSEIANS